MFNPSYFIFNTQANYFIYFKLKITKLHYYKFKLHTIMKFTRINFTNVCINFKIGNIISILKDSNYVDSLMPNSVIEVMPNFSLILNSGEILY